MRTSLTQSNFLRNHPCRLPRIVAAGRGLLVAVSLLPALLSAQQVRTPEGIRQVDIEEKLGATLPLELTFTDADGQRVTLGDYFGDGRPVVLVLAYYECPMLCTLVLNGLSNAITEAKLEPGEQYRIVTVSIDPDETPALARDKRARYLEATRRTMPADAWSFLVGDQASIARLADAVGFRYQYDPQQDQYAHPAVIHLVTPEGKVSRYLYGIEFEPRDFRLGLLEASEGRIGNLMDRVLLFCFHYDPQGKRYALFAQNIMRLGGAVTLVLLAVMLGMLWYRERHRQVPSQIPAPPSSSAPPNGN